jgi:hypothetical protein
MATMQNIRDVVRSEVQTQVRAATRVSQGRADALQAPAKAAPADAPGAPAAPAIATPIPEGGGRLIVDRDGDRTVFTTTALPPEAMRIARMAQETAFGLMGLLAAIIILGPFARMIARRMERRTEVNAGSENARLTQQQLLQLQQSIDAMSLEVERISEGQRFTSKLLHERRNA